MTSARDGTDFFLDKGRNLKSFAQIVLNPPVVDTEESRHKEKVSLYCGSWPLVDSQTKLKAKEMNYQREFLCGAESRPKVMRFLFFY